jgi:hypothetical protein
MSISIELGNRQKKARLDRAFYRMSMIVYVSISIHLS